MVAGEWGPFESAAGGGHGRGEEIKARRGLIAWFCRRRRPHIYKRLIIVGELFPIISGDFLIIMIVIPDSFAFSKQHKKTEQPPLGCAHR